MDDGKWEIRYVHIAKEFEGIAIYQNEERKICKYVYKLN